MAPALVNTSTLQQPLSSPVKLSAFPDGLKTSGQHPPVYSQVRPYKDFPKIQTGPTVWKAEDYRENPELWTHRFSSEEIAEISTASDDFIKKGAPLTGISKENFHLPHLRERLEALRKDLVDGKGFFLFRGLPVQDWDLQKCATAYMGIGTYLGYFVSQNGRGHVLGHVKDLGEDPTKTDRVRIYRTNARQYFHTDGADFVGLLCIAKSLSGGESDIASTHHVFNVLQERHPDVVQTLCEPNWYFDRKGEISEGEDGWIRGSIFYLENDCRRQKRALEIFEKTCAELSLHMILAPGDIQFLSNAQVFHARTAYTDHPPGAVDEEGRPARRRHLMRLWLAAPESEGGWRLPYHDTMEKKRGGIQVNDTPPVCPLDAE
ncbi:uncharacterized protein N7529_005460 [Penicillium soppii]|uniref:uncharacterized protein n=1 Tax=Penicillium soppii TaxID=69789 RepID=UPI0025486960|nr:uncharacterized protein N7529_005460 [Penicillium soppii]KAJ5863544.1 hypothetical protein N7529_005460 [Penicillium soppii]